VSLVKIANDLRWMGSGPRAGIGEITLPDLQPGSSIMPGKVNPVLPEATVMVAAQVIGNDAAITFAGAQGNFDLLVMLPVMARNLLESITLVGKVSQVLATRCVDGIEANVERCLELAQSSPAIVTPLNRIIGYEAAAKIAKHAVKANLTIAEAVRDLGYVARGEISEDQLRAALDVRTMTGN
jgi:fumarate hydratase class II